MDIRKILSSILLLIGEVLIILCFLHFGSRLEIKVLTLNIVITSIVFALLFVDIIVPFIDLNDKSQRQVGSLGLRTFSTYGYMLIAIAAMIFFNYNNHVDFGSQLLLHAILLFVFLVGIYFTVNASSKVKEVYDEQTQVRNRIDEMKKATSDVLIKIEKLNNIPSEIRNKVATLLENLRFLSVSNNPNAFDLEESYTKEMKSIYDRLFDLNPDNNKITEHINNCERTIKQRKQIYSN